MTDDIAREFDLLVIGGGITGCGVARDASMRGLRVILCEREDFASGTSGRSSRLIHGGIRYLEHAQFHLVQESIRERQILLGIAPHLVKPLAFTWPIYAGARVGKIKLKAGLFLYDLLSAGRSTRHAMLDVAETVSREPGLNRDGLRGGAVYYDAATDDSRLTLANAIAARQHGATILTHAPVVRLVRDGAKSIGAVVRFADPGEEREIRARSIVNATGVWKTNFGGDEDLPRQRGSKGVHIAVARERVGNRDALTLVSPIDGRVMFCLPAGSQTIIGTTDTWTSESPEMAHASETDVDYLLRSANAYFPGAALTADDVISAWAGIRPLASGGSANPSAVSREHSISTDRYGVINVTGGKLTTYRSMAAEIVDLVQRSRGGAVKRAPTNSVLLPGAERSAAVSALTRANPSLNAALVEGLPYTAADLIYGVREEMAKTLTDLLVRRTHLAFETRDHGAGVALKAADIVASELGWDGEMKSARVRDYKRDIERIFSIGGAATGR